MENKTDNGGEFPRLYTIHSQKGGVGKTSVAIAIAGCAAIFHKKKSINHRCRYDRRQFV